MQRLCKFIRKVEFIEDTGPSKPIFFGITCYGGFKLVFVKDLFKCIRRNDIVEYDTGNWV